MSIRQKKLPINSLERIDNLCSEFEHHWQTNQRPKIESFIPEDLPSPERDALLAELIVLDVDYRQRRKETPQQQEYLDRFPEDSELIQEALNLDDKRTRPFNPPSIETLAKRFPSLQIIELIGMGGMGAVYKAKQEGLDRMVALKILPEEFSHDPKFALRFTREARTLAKLNHPNIVAVYEFGNIEETFYFLMEYIEGSTLRETVKTRQLAPEHAMTIVPYLCDALQFAHDKGVIHRDIKPENILISVDGTVKLADFGLARLLENESQSNLLTGTHQVMGTLRYMAPEQFEESRSVDHRADIYSLGVVFYEMLTGELPIGRFEMPSQKVQVDVRLDDVVLRSLEREPQRRYQHASDIKSDVQLIASKDNPAFAKTVIGESISGSHIQGLNSLEQQELAGRMLLTRRQLMERVEDSLRPLFRAQLTQILFGILLIIIGAMCWAPNTQVTHRLVCGLLVHIYGVILIGSAAAVCTKIKKIDYSKPVAEVRERLNLVRKVYLRVGPVIGFPWWLMWIPLGVAIGFDVILHPNSLYPSLVVGILGLVISGYLYVRLLGKRNESSNTWKEQFAGKSIRSAELALKEITQAQIQ